MDLVTFAPTEITLVKRDIIARKLQVRAFFMPYYQVSQDIAVACRFERKPIFPHLISSLCDVISVGGNGGNRFFNLAPINRNNIMQSKSTPQLGYTPEQLNFINLYFEPEKAAYTARALRMLCLAALENDAEHNPQHIAEALFLAELLLDVSLSEQK